MTPYEFAAAMVLYIKRQLKVVRFRS